MTFSSAEIAMADSIRVLIADDHLIFRLGLKSLLNNEPDIVVAGEAGTGAQTVERFKGSATRCGGP